MRYRAVAVDSVHDIFVGSVPRIRQRRDDVVIYRDTGTVTRSNTLDYNLPFLNSTLGVIASVTMVCYIMYTISPEVTRRLDSSYVYVTSVFVLAESYAICSRQQCARRAESYRNALARPFHSAVHTFLDSYICSADIWLKKIVVAFDFDGTLISRRFSLCHRPPRAWHRKDAFGIAACNAAIVKWKLGLSTNSRAKEKLFANFYKGMRWPNSTART